MPERVECVREMLQGHPSFQIGGQCVFQVAGVLVAFGLGQEFLAWVVRVGM